MPGWDTVQHNLSTVTCLRGISRCVDSYLRNHRCWDGRNTDSPTHREHVSHPVGGPVAFPMVNGKCPDSHPVKIPQLMLEVNWDTRIFNDAEEWEGGGQPLFLSTGDQ